MKPYKSASYVLTLFFLFLSSFLWGQNVFAPLKGAKWTYVYNSNAFNGFTGEEWVGKSIIKAEYLRDSTIETQNYKYILLNYEALNTYYKPTIVNGRVARYDTTISKNKTIRKFYTRQTQDTIFGFVDDKTNESVYYIFKANRDSFDIKKLNFDDYRTKKVFIDSIKTTQVGNRSFKTWKGKSYQRLLADSGTGYDTFGLTFLERIGPIDDIMLFFGFNGHPGNINRNAKYGLVCYEDSEVGLLKFMDVDCNISPTKEGSKNIIVETYFNRFKNSIEIHLGVDNINPLNLSLFNISGQLILTQSLKDVDNSVIVPRNLPSGIYFTHFIDKITGSTLVKKIFIN
jgi:hypothetical protein